MRPHDLFYMQVSAKITRFIDSELKNGFSLAKLRESINEHKLYQIYPLNPDISIMVEYGSLYEGISSCVNRHLYVWEKSNESIAKGITIEDFHLELILNIVQIYKEKGWQVKINDQGLRFIYKI